MKWLKRVYAKRPWRKPNLALVYVEAYHKAKPPE